MVIIITRSGKKLVVFHRGGKIRLRAYRRDYTGELPLSPALQATHDRFREAGIDTFGEHGLVEYKSRDGVTRLMPKRNALMGSAIKGPVNARHTNHNERRNAYLWGLFATTEQTLVRFRDRIVAVV